MGIPEQEASNDSGVSETAIFSAFSSYVFRSFRDKATPLQIYIKSIVGFPLIPKQVTLNDHEWPFYVKFCFLHQYVELDNCGFQSQLRAKCERMKTCTLYTLSATHMFSRDSCFWRYKVYAYI